MADDPAARPLVYFLCVGNAMRSQMAEGFLKRWAGDRFEVASAGTHPLGRVLSEVDEVMRELDIDLTEHTSNPIEAEVVEKAEIIIDLGGRGRDFIPGAFLEKYRHWNISDPYGAPMGDLRATRDEIGRRVRAFIDQWPDV